MKVILAGIGCLLLMGLCMDLQTYVVDLKILEVAEIAFGIGGALLIAVKLVEIIT